MMMMIIMMEQREEEIQFKEQNGVRDRGLYGLYVHTDCTLE